MAKLSSFTNNLELIIQILLTSKRNDANMVSDKKTPAQARENEGRKNKMTKKQIEIIRKYTPEELKGTQPHTIKTLATYTPRNANWSYRAVYVEHNGAKILVVTRFGEVL